MSSGTRAVPALACSGVVVRYGRTTALDGISLRVEQGSVYALLGRNGSGKTSLVRCLLGHRRPERGDVRLFGRDVWHERRTVMSRTAVVPEEPDMPPAMTATQLVSFFGRLYPHWHGDAVMARIGRLGITADVAFGRLSKGERRQLALALALGSSPELLVLDDPTLGLDVIARRELYEELVGDLADRGTTVFMTSHDLAGIEGIADRVGILHGGRLMVDEELETLKARFRRIRFPAPADGDAEPSGGDELARFGPVSLGPGPWGEEAVVERFEAGTFESVAGSGRFIGAEAAPMNLEEIFSAVALAGERGST